MMASLGHEPTAGGIAALYADLGAQLVVDPADAAQAPGALACPIVMVEPERREEVGRAILEAVS
jgi:hypothetical protein